MARMRGTAKKLAAVVVFHRVGPWQGKVSSDVVSRCSGGGDAGSIVTKPAVALGVRKRKVVNSKVMTDDMTCERSVAYSPRPKRKKTVADPGTIPEGALKPFQKLSERR
jgi:hypothetical protein